MCSCEFVPVHPGLSGHRAHGSNSSSTVGTHHPPQQTQRQRVPFPLHTPFYASPSKCTLHPNSSPSSESSFAKPPITHTLHPPTSPAATHHKPHLKKERSLSSDAPTPPHWYATVSHVLVHGVRCCDFFCWFEWYGYSISRTILFPSRRKIDGAEHRVFTTMRGGFVLQELFGAD